MCLRLFFSTLMLYQSISVPLVQGRRWGRCQCLDSGGWLSRCLIHFWYHLSHAADFAPQLMLIYAHAVRVFYASTHPPIRMSIHHLRLSPAHSGVSSWQLHYPVYMVLPNLRRKLRALSASEWTCSDELAAIPMTMTLMRASERDECVCIALYALSLPLYRLIE